MRSRLSEKKSEVNGGIDRRRRFFFSGHFGDRGIVHAAIGTDLVCACSVTCDVGVSDGCNCAELHGDLNADILADGEYALAVFDDVAGIFPCGHRRPGAAFRDRRSCFCKRRHRNGNADRRKLIGNGGTSLIFIRKLCYNDLLKKSLRKNSLCSICIGNGIGDVDGK